MAAENGAGAEPGEKDGEGDDEPAEINGGVDVRVKMAFDAIPGEGGNEQRGDDSVDPFEGEQGHEHAIDAAVDAPEIFLKELEGARLVFRREIQRDVGHA